MRILLTTCPSHGHLFPAVPMAWALRNAGHDVLLPVPQSLAEMARSTGLPTVQTPDVSMMGILADTFAPLLAKGFATASEEERGRYGALAFTRLAEAGAPGVADVAAQWRPDLVLHDTIDFTGPLAAAIAGAPAVAFGWGTWLPPQLTSILSAQLGPLYERFGAPQVRLEPAAAVDVCPPSLSGPTPPTVRRLRFVPYNGAAPVPAWLLTPPATPRILVTLGGSVGDRGSQVGSTLLDKLLDGLADIDAEVVLAVSEAPALDNPPARLRVEPWLPLGHVVPGCDLVIHHGGSGSCLTAAAYGVPQLVLPQLADHFRFAGKVAATGAGQSLMPPQCTPSNINAAVRALLGTPGFRDAAQQVRAEITAVPPVSGIVEVVEGLGQDRPVPTPAFRS
jgi:UDP:flavonoid glycosyltransferase YjiC (YdhE family)